MTCLREEDIADTEFDELHVDLGELNSELDIVKLSTNGQDTSEELLGIIRALALSMSGMALHNGRTEFKIDSCKGLPLLFAHPHSWYLFVTWHLLHWHTQQPW